jgi:hypothetical protein
MNAPPVERMASVWFVMGKGGVGRTTVAAALGARFAAAGERVLIVQWALGDAVAPLFGALAGGADERVIAPGLSTMCYSEEAALREYFVDHLGLRWLHTLVVRNRHVQRLTRAVPSLDELLFLGRLYWLNELAGAERGWRYDRVIVDAPALGHGLSLFGVPRAAASLGLGGLLAGECARVQAMIDDPSRCAAIMISTAEELAVEETLELGPLLARELGRPPILSVINRSLTKLGVLPAPPGSLDPSLAPLYGALQRREAREQTLEGRLAKPVLRIDEALLGERSPRACAEAAVGEWLSCRG